MWNLALSTSRGFVFSHDSSGASTSSRPLSVPLNASSVGLKLSHCMYFKGVTNKRIPSQCVILPPKTPHSFCVALPDRHKSWIWSFASYLNIQASFCFVSLFVCCCCYHRYMRMFSLPAFMSVPFCLHSPVSQSLQRACKRWSTITRYAITATGNWIYLHYFNPKRYDCLMTKLSRQSGTDLLTVTAFNYCR